MKSHVPDEKKKPVFEELDLGEGLICDPETGICEIPGTGAPKLPPPAEKPTPKKGER